MRPDTGFAVGPQIQVADRVIKEAHGTGGLLTVSRILAQSSNVGAVKIGLRLGAQRFDQLGAQVRLRATDRRAAAGRVARHRAAGEGLLGIVDGEPADRPGPRGHADPDGGRLRGDRQRRRVGEAAAGAGRRARPKAGGSCPAARRARSSACSRACSGPTGPRPRRPSPGYDIAGKTGTAEKAEDGGYSESKFVASFIGFAPARRRAPAGGGDRGRARRRAHGWRGGGARLREDRQLRASVPGHRAQLGRRSRLR